MRTPSYNTHPALQPRLRGPPLVTVIIVLIIGSTWNQHPRALVLPPPWANETLNPCTSESWQLLHWPQDDRCYYIFQQGPCRETQEIFFDRGTGKAGCRCARGTSWHKETNRCHTLHSRGPCGHREYFNFRDLPGDEAASESRDGVCHQYKPCPPGHVFWPPSGTCFPHLSRGPCLHGDLLYVHPHTGTTECGCHGDVMSTNYWPHDASCHELFTQGPCVEGHLFVYNLTEEATECACGPRLPANYHRATGRCFELQTTGPCGQGQAFTYDTLKGEAGCACLLGYATGPHGTGPCYRAFTRGPCSRGKFLKPDADRVGLGSCVKNPCASGNLYDPDSGRCYAVGRRGPCARGKLWVFERAASIRGLCHCDEHLIGYWAPHGTCYELGERGPCPKRKVLSLERRTGVLQCHCDYRRGFVPWVNGRCIKAGVRRDKLVPVAGPSRPHEGVNAISGDRVHRGLSLPSTAEGGREGNQVPEKGPFPTSPPPSARALQSQPTQAAQEEILKDVLSAILERDGSSHPVGPSRGGPTHLHTETNTEKAIHRITVSRSVTERRTQWRQAPSRSSKDHQENETSAETRGGERAAGIGPHKEGFSRRPQGRSQ